MIFVVVSTVVAIVIASFVLAFRALVSRPKVDGTVLDWFDSFDVESYTPMERLLDESDIAFLASQPGYKPVMGKQLMAERRRIFRDYLHLLLRDFNQLIAIGKFMVVFASQDRPELANTLIREQLAFYLAVSRIRMRLAFHPLFPAGIDVRNLVRTLAAVRDQVHQLAAARINSPQPA